MVSGSSTTSVNIPDWLQAAAQQTLARAQDISSLGYTPYYGPDVAAMTPMQMAAGQGINAAAGAFGLPTTDLSMGMPAPQTFAGGVQGYSSGALYDQALAELRRRAPGQYNALMNLFVNPRTGAAPLSFGPSVQPVSPATPAPVVDRDRDQGQNRNNAPLSFGDNRDNRSTTSIATLASYLPGGVNTRNPASAMNQAAAAATSGGNRNQPTAPTSSPRPITRSTSGSGNSNAGSSNNRGIFGGYTGLRDMFDGGGPGASRNQRGR